MLSFATSSCLIDPGQRKKCHLLQMSRDVVFQLSAFPHAEVANPIGFARRLLEHGLNLNKIAIVKHRAMIFPHVIDEIPLIFIIWVTLCVAKPHYPVALAFMLVPLVSALEEIIA